MLNKKVSETIDAMADLLELDDANPFKIRAFRRGAQIIDTHPDDVGNLDRKNLLAIPGIGNGIADIIEELKQGASVSEFVKLKKKFPQGVLDIMDLQGMGPKRAAFLFKKKKIDSVKKLSEAAKSNKLVEFAGFGPKLQESILKTIAFSQESSKRTLLSDALKVSSEYKHFLYQESGIKDLQMAGSLRRWKETVGDLDFICTSKNPNVAIDHFVSYPDVKRVLVKGKTKASVLLSSGLQCDLRVIDKIHLGAALLYFTGSKEHNVRIREYAQKKGLTLNEYGLFKVSDKKQLKPVASKTEEEVYKKLGMQWIPPELREDRGEVDAALNNKIPKLLEEKDVLGDIHNHTNLSDGENTLEEMVDAAKKKGWKWFFSADHSPSLIIASGLPVQTLKKKQAAVHQLNQKNKNFHIFCSSEVDILGDGKIDYPDAVLESLDCVVASVHSRFKQTQSEMTQRIIKALNHKYVDILGHISGRLINRRESYELDYEAVLQAASKTQTAIEINGQAGRQELRDIYIKKALEEGVPLILSTDAHSTQQLDNMTMAVHIARRGWAQKKDVLNTLPIDKLKKWINRPSSKK